MKIGIISMQRIRNYGSFLQAYGLKSTIESLGHEVVFIDYKVEKSLVERQKEKFFFRVKRKINKVIRSNILKNKDINLLYDDEYLPLLGVSKQKKYNTPVDVLVIGSDEVFNCLQSNPLVGYSKELFGANANAKHIISYAGSFGHTTLEGLKEYKIDKEVGELFKKFKSISVRDSNSFKIIKNIVGKEPTLNVDPVIISNFDKHIIEQKELKDYILVYAYGNRINSKEEISAIKQFAKKHNKKLISIGTHQDWTDIKLNVNPFELLGYVKAADYIITDTFHGSIFAIKYNRPFATIIRESNKQKLGDLLRRFSVADREITKMNKLEEILLRPINFNKVNKIMEEETQKSIQYLENNLSI